MQHITCKEGVVLVLLVWLRINAGWYDLGEIIPPWYDTTEPIQRYIGSSMIQAEMCGGIIF